MREFSDGAVSIPLVMPARTNTVTALATRAITTLRKLSTSPPKSRHPAYL